VKTAGREESLLDPIAWDAPELEATQFARVIDLILTENLLRFSSFRSHVRMSSAVRWGSEGKLADDLSRLRTLLLSPQERAKNLAEDNVETLWAALNAEFFLNGETAADIVDGLLDSDRPLARAIAAELAHELPDFPQHVLRLLRHDDPFVAAAIVSDMKHRRITAGEHGLGDPFDALMDLADRAPKKPQSFANRLSKPPTSSSAGQGFSTPLSR